jgi:POT family proton-dependent oligopeptide transporter
MSVLKQPRGFSVFFLTEMWERYGFYIAQTLLIFYLIHHFHLNDFLSYTILGSFTALAYINPSVGGYVADRYLGPKKAILWGAIIISVGYVILAFTSDLLKVFIALAVISAGTGLLKPNISSFLGRLYKKNDVRRHTGYTIFYVGINLGIILSTSLGDYLQQILGWQITYATAAFVLLIAWATFFLGSRFYLLKDSFEDKRKYLPALFVVIAMIMLNSLIIIYHTLTVVVFSLVAILSVGVILYEWYRSNDKGEKNRLLAYLILTCISVVFWTLYFQLFFSMNLFVDRVVDRNIFGFTIPPSVFLAIQSFALIIFGPLIGALWSMLARRGKEISIPGKFTGGLIMTTLAFALLFMSSLFKNNQGLVMAMPVILVYFIIAIGELMLSPIGLAMVSELAPQRISGMMMGIFFISLGIGGKLAGVLANYAAITSDVIGVDKMEALYHHAFGADLIICLVITLISFSLMPFIKRLIRL